MKIFKKLMAFAMIATASFMLFSCSSSASSTGSAGSNIAEHSKSYVADKDIIVLYTNDIHCAYKPNEKKGTMGFANLVAYKKAALNKTPNVTLVDNGDLIQGEAIGTVSRGKSMVDLANQAGYDFAIFGNHEFDYGMDRLGELLSISKAQYLNCNISYVGKKKNKIANVKPYQIVNYGGTKVAFIGVTTPWSVTTSTPKYFMDEGSTDIVYKFASGENLYKKVQGYVDEARSKGAQYVIAMTHLGIEEDCRPDRSYDLIHNTTGIDAVLDAHSHSRVEYELVQNKEQKNVVYTQTGTKLATIGELTITPNGKISSKLISGYNAVDSDTDNFVKAIDAEFTATMAKVVATNQAKLSVTDEKGFRAVRNRETAIGDFVADAYRAITDSDVAFINGGGIRKDIPMGDVTNQDIINVHPFGNYLCMVETTGQQILDALELGAMNTTKNANDGANAIGESGGFLQVSGMKYTIDTSVKSGVQKDEKGFFKGVNGERRVKDVQVLNKATNKYEPIDPAKKYKLTSHNYKLQNMGDGYNMFVNDKYLLDKSIQDNLALITYIRDYLGGVIPASKYGKVAGRITIV